MSIRVALSHTTEYRYDRSVRLDPHVIRLRPAPHCRTPILSYSLKVEPAVQFLNWQQDPYSNYLARLVFPEPTRELRVVVDLVAEMTAINPFDFFIEPAAEHYPFVYDPILARELVPYLETAPAGPQLLALVNEMRRKDIRIIDYLVEINQHLQQRIRYLIRMEPGVQTCEETLAFKSGSCRDSAWLMVQLLRHLGLAARFVSGYLIQLTADEKSLDGPSGPEKDFTDLHAWAEVYFPGAGWVGFDPTSGLAASEGHLPLACAADPITAAPITGAFHWGAEGEGRADFGFQMSVRRVHEAPRVTKPYTEEQWRAIDLLGDRIDAELQANDVRLTMGGEPTFVSIDSRDAPEWNTAANGLEKQKLADILLHRLQVRFAPGGFLLHSQGKWYPGEPLPRWSYSCFWRRDGVPLWKDGRWSALLEREYGFGPTQAERFIRRLAERLSVNPDHCEAGYEDAWYLLWRERRLPVGVDPLNNRLSDPLERERLARAFEEGLDRVIGYALPLRKRSDGTAWESGKWQVRGHLFLYPGDSPMGLRLPLDLLPWGPNELLRSVLCVEPRGGRLHVFLPPMPHAGPYLDLIAAIEATAAELQLPVLLEGYKPPYDDRLTHFQITPDPGVIEVNIHPSHNWRDLVENTTALYEEARAARLCTEKFMLDGRHTGTGGGNHVVIGGPTIEDSPLLRRPDLLRSLLTLWNNHPALSYLFSSLFIGPTSQAPRVDEARHDTLHELELAFTQIPDPGPDTPRCPSWLVDRVFRHLLIDVTGNTHRAEFCIDKLYPLENPEGRRGLLELRAFEMPPHARMSLVQQLLLRSVIAWFWKQPYRKPLVRWGTALHDRFMLHHFVERDFADVLTELQLAGYPLDPTWFAPHLEFRFPLLGTVNYENIQLELRQAIEPWHVLGEEATGNATARYVDSSVERVQVKVRGMSESRYLLACNGRQVPLHPTGQVGEFVAGVRYRAWHPPSALHPTIPVHAPLIFDLFDTWTGRSLGGCQYHVSHPGGRAHEIFPVNAGEAEGRRKARFLAFGHTSELRRVTATRPRPEAPLTLDLRQPVGGLAPESLSAPLPLPGKLEELWERSAMDGRSPQYPPREGASALAAEEDGLRSGATRDAARR